MRSDNHRGRPAWRRWLGIVAPVAGLAGGMLAASPAAAQAATPAAASSSHFAYACGSQFTRGEFHCLVVKNTAAHPTAQNVRPGSLEGNGYGPSDFQSAYGLTAASASDGSGTTVAVVDAYNDPTAAGDLATYRSDAGLPALAAGQFTQYNQEGETSPLPPTAPVNNDWTLEESLDVDMVSAICPLCQIDLVEADNDGSDGLYTAEQTAATTLGAKYISNSWGGVETSTDTTYDSEYFGVPGVVYTASAGDDGYGVSYPATSPNVVSVGGTTLNPAGNARGWTESVWDTNSTEGTGSGCSGIEPQPSWQASLPIITAACSDRVDNDVAADADPSTGAAVYDTSNGNDGWNEVGGTSESSPMIAAVFALAGNNGDDGNNAADSIYTHTGNLYEVTASSNGTCTPPSQDSVLCTATGAANTYNGPTGWGTPDGLTAFQSTAGSHTITVTNPGDQTGTVSTAVSLQIQASDSDPGQTLTYSATGLPAGLSINSATGLISGTATNAADYRVTVTVSDPTGASGSATFTWNISVRSTRQLLRNPGFESGVIRPWKGSTGVLASTSEGVPAHSGSWLAWFDGYGQAHTDTLTQKVTIPADCSKASLSFWLYVNSDDPANAAYDTFTVRVLNAHHVVKATLGTFSNLNAGSGYVRHFYRLTKYVGQTIIIEFTGTETLGDGYDTNFFEDGNRLAVS